MVIVVSDFVGSADTAAQGALLFARLRAAARLNDDDIVVSFAGICTATSSFVNASFVELLCHMTLGDLKRRVRVISSTAQINDMIKRRLQREASVHA